MNKHVLIVLGIVLLSLLFVYLYSQVNNHDDKKVAFIISHADDETIGAGGVISILIKSGYKLHFDLMTSGNSLAPTLRIVNNYYNASISKDMNDADRKGIIREDSFKQVMKVINVTNYRTHGFDDGALTTDEVFSVMEDLYLKDGYTTFYTTTGDGNPDHHACHEAMKRMKEKYPNLKYRQFPIYYYHQQQAKPEPLNINYVDVNVDKLNQTKKELFQVYYNINTLLPSFYPRSDGVIGFGPERIYYNNDSIAELS
ncbi:MAG: PIG-L family deacetylase [Methanobrevibacter sp.]|jgi:LmbE family N-acetylglucosaminyl deacetylase|nr:PIG-L family deacetylase [Candidatus Methanovirga basalitermitum]